MNFGYAFVTKSHITLKNFIDDWIVDFENTKDDIFKMVRKLWKHSNVFSKINEFI